MFSFLRPHPVRATAAPEIPVSREAQQSLESAAKAAKNLVAAWGEFMVPPHGSADPENAIRLQLRSRIGDDSGVSVGGVRLRLEPTGELSAAQVNQPGWSLVVKPGGTGGVLQISHTAPGETEAMDDLSIGSDSTHPFRIGKLGAMDGKIAGSKGTNAQLVMAEEGGARRLRATALAIQFTASALRELYGYVRDDLSSASGPQVERHPAA